MTRDQKTAIIWIVVACIVVGFTLFGSSINSGLHDNNYNGTPTCEQAYAKNKDTISASHDDWVKDCDDGLNQLPEPR